MKQLFIFCAILALGSCGSTSEPPELQVSPLDSLNAVILKSPNDAALYFERAKLLYDQRDLKASMSDVGRALRLDSTKAEFYLLLADLKIVDKQSRESRDALLKAYRFNPKSVDVLVKLGELYMIVGDAENSFRYLNEALKLDVHRAEAYRMKGFNYKFLKDTVNAVSSFQTAIEQDPEDFDSYMQLGLLYAIAKHPMAVDYYNNAIRVRPEHLEAYYAKALFLQETGSFRGALLVYDEIIKLNPNYFNAYYNKGYIYLEQLDQPDSASTCFTLAIENGPESYYVAVYNRGLCAERMGNLKKAESDYRLALTFNPQYDAAALGLSRILD